MKKKASLLGGLAIGAGLGILFAPKKGKETREDIKTKLNEVANKAKEIDMDDVKEYVVTKSEEIEAALKDLNKEKVKEIAKEKAKEIEKNAKDLVAYVKKKGEPVLIEASETLRQKAIETTKNVLKKLEEK